MYNYKCTCTLHGTTWDWQTIPWVHTVHAPIAIHSSCTAHGFNHTPPATDMNLILLGTRILKVKPLAKIHEPPPRIFTCATDWQRSTTFIHRGEVRCAYAPGAIPFSVLPVAQITGRICLHLINTKFLLHGKCSLLQQITEIHMHYYTTCTLLIEEAGQALSHTEHILCVCVCVCVCVCARLYMMKIVHCFSFQKATQVLWLSKQTSFIVYYWIPLACVDQQWL